MGALAGAVMLATGSAQAQTTSTAITPGSWKTEYRVLLNGQDSSVLIGQANAQIRKALPSALNNKASLGVNASTGRGNASVCVTPQAATTMASPTAIFELFSKMNPLCRLVAGKATSNSVPFTGRCDDPNSFTGNVQGQVKFNSPISWNADMAGLGRFPNATLTAMKLPTTSLVRMQATSTNRWVSATCS